MSQRLMSSEYEGCSRRYLMISYRSLVRKIDKHCFFLSLAPSCFENERMKQFQQHSKLFFVACVADCVVFCDTSAFCDVSRVRHNFSMAGATYYAFATYFLH